MTIPHDARVLMVPVVDVNWLTYAPFDPGRDFRVDPPKVEQSIGETRELHGILRDLVDGRYVLTPHSGTYCRTGYYEGAMLEVYKEAVEDGAEVAVHLHEEIKGVGTRYAEADHMREVFADCRRRLEAAGIRPTSYRAGHYAYAPLTNALLEEHGILVDLSCSPGLNEPSRQAIWTEAELSAYYLPANPRLPAAGQPRSRVLEIPIGSDGEGAAYRNILHVEQSELDNLERVWDVVAARAEREGRPQIVHSLFHTGSMGRPDWVERYKRFLDMTRRKGGVPLTASAAKAAHDRLEAAAA